MLNTLKLIGQLTGLTILCISASIIIYCFIGEYKLVCPVLESVLKVIHSYIALKILKKVPPINEILIYTFGVIIIPAALVYLLRYVSIQDLSSFLLYCLVYSIFVFGFCLLVVYYGLKLTASVVKKKIKQKPLTNKKV